MSPGALPRRVRAALRRRWRFARWTGRLRRELRRHGARLVVEAPHRADWEAYPAVRVQDYGEGDRTLTIRLGHNVTFGRGVTIEIYAHGTNVLEIGDDVFLLDNVRLQLRGGAIRLGRRSEVRDSCVLKSEGELVVGELVPISFGCILHCNDRIELHERCGLAERVSIIDSDHTVDGSDEHFYTRPLRIAPVVVGSNTFVAANAVLTRGVTVGRNAVVAAGAVLTGGDYPDGHLIAGVPARAVRPLRGGEGDHT